MGREVRRVPPDWEHPKNKNGDYIPLYDGYGYERAAQEFLAKLNAEGLQAALVWFCHAPDQRDYMPTWEKSETTHYMMYENTTEGTPISPAFSTPEALALWLAENNASAFGDQTASYESWLRVANGGYAPTFVFSAGTLKSGVDGLTE